MPPTRRCTGKTKAGKPCKANPLKGTTKCLAHSPAETRASVGFTPDAGALGGRPRLPKPTDIARQLVERHVFAVLRPHFKALGLHLEDDGSVTPLARGAIITGESKDGDVVASTIEDLGAQIAAAEKLLDRVYGRPKQTQEITGADGGPVEMVPVARERGPDVVRILTGTGVLPVPASNGNGNGHAAHN